MEFKERLRDLRLKKHMKSKEVAQLVGISDHTYISYENRGSQPPYDVLIKLSKVFGVTTDFLLGVDQDVYEPIVNEHTFGERLKELRQNKQLTGQEVATVLGVALSTYTSYENRNSQPAFDVLEKMAILFGVSLDYLITGKRKNQQFENIRLAGYTVKELDGRYIVSDKEREYNLPGDKLTMIEESLDIMQRKVCSKELVKNLLGITIMNK